MKTRMHVSVSAPVVLLSSVALLSAALLMAPASVLGQELILHSCVLGAGGAPGSTPCMLANGTLGQPQPIGRGSSGHVAHSAGFWATVMDFGAESVAQLPVGWTNALQQNTPNPFGELTGINFSSARQENVSLVVFDIRGANVRTLVEGEMVPGVHRIVWDGTDDRTHRVAAGIYFCWLRIGDFQAVKRMVLVK